MTQEKMSPLRALAEISSLQRRDRSRYSSKPLRNLNGQRSSPAGNPLAAFGASLLQGMY